MARRDRTSKARKRARAKAIRNGRSRARKLAAAGMLGGLLLVPSMIANGPGLGLLPVTATGLSGVSLPVPGDILRRLGGGGFDDPAAENLGASGRLPEVETLPPDELAELAQPQPSSTGAGPLASVPPGPLGIPGVVLKAYLDAATQMEMANARCGVSWPVLAAIGRIESGHARGGRVDANGTTLSPILGPQLNGGPGIAAIPDSDDGRLDFDTVWDRAVGPMQFIPTTWARYAADGNSDGKADPHNAFDATLAAARFLCTGGGDLRDPVALAGAIFRYNHSESYVRTVLAWASAYATGVTPLPSLGPDGQQVPLPPGALALPAVPVFPTSPTSPTSSTAPAGSAPGTATSPTTTRPGSTTSTASPTSPTSSTSSTTTTTSTTTETPTPTPEPTTTLPPTTTTTSETCPTATPTTTETTTPTETTTVTPPPGCPSGAPASAEPTTPQP